MADFGYTLMGEQSAPTPPVDNAVRAETAGFDFADAGCTHIALLQVGADGQHAFLDFAEHDLLPALRSQPGWASP